MEPMPGMSREEDVAAMKVLAERMLGEVADAINQAPDGPIIAGREERVRDRFGEFRRQAFEAGLQTRITAAQAAFPPSAGPGDPAAPPQQGAPGGHHPDRQRPGRAAAGPLDRRWRQRRRD